MSSNDNVHINIPTLESINMQVNQYGITGVPNPQAGDHYRALSPLEPAVEMVTMRTSLRARVLLLCPPLMEPSPSPPPLLVHKGREVWELGLGVPM